MKIKERDVIANRLRSAREAIFKEVADTESDLTVIAEDREIELEERAQDEGTERFLAHLDERGKREIEAIDVALRKLSEGTYGVCETCKKTIPLARLRVLPSTPLCVYCARDREVLI